MKYPRLFAKTNTSRQLRAWSISFVVLFSLALILVSGRAPAQVTTESPSDKTERTDGSEDRLEVIDEMADPGEPSALFDDLEEGPANEPQAVPPSSTPGAPPASTPSSSSAATATPVPQPQTPPIQISPRSELSAGATADQGEGGARQPGEPPPRVENLDFRDADIHDVVRAFSDLTGKNFIVDPTVKGKISIIAPSPVSVDEAFRAFLSALAINGYTVVPSGKFYKVLSSRNAQRDSISTYIKKDVPPSDQMVTRIIKLQHISATEIQRNMRNLVSKDGDMMVYEPTNSLILSDYGLNIRRIMTILTELDKPGFQERMSVIPIRYAKAKDLATLIEKIINKGQSGTSGRGAGGTNMGGAFGPRTFTPAGGTSATVKLSVVTPDDRTNSLIVVGNQEGIEEVRMLVEELDFKMDPAAAGGVFVYRLKHSLAESVSSTLTGITSRAATTAAPRRDAQAAPDRPFAASGSTTIFGGDVQIVPDKNTNSLVIVASKPDYDIVRSLLEKIDVPRDQVYVQAVIMEINTEKTRNWQITAYYLDPNSNGLGRIGFASPGALSNFLNPTGDTGAILSFSGGTRFTATFGETSYEISSVLGFINFLQRHTDANILSTPQIIALDNEDASIEVGDQVPIGIKTVTTQVATTQSPEYEQATIKLEITPNISPESDTIRMKVAQSVRQASEATVRAAALQDIATVIATRTIKTNIIVQNQDTVVLGGLMRDEEARTEVKVPILGDIPILGWLFKSKNTTRRKVNLLVFLTPKIIRNQEDSRDLLGRTINERKQWLGETLVGPDPFNVRVEQLLAPPPPTKPRTEKPSDATEEEIRKTPSRPGPHEAAPTTEPKSTPTQAVGQIP